jgi:regulatory protein
MEPADADWVLALAYRFLGRRERTRRELRAHLAAKGCEEPLIEHALAVLSEQGYLDDERFARLFVEDKRTLEGWGSDRIARSLRERGLDREIVEAALAGRGREQELEQALDILRRRCPAPPADPRARERALGILLRKGYDSELALDALSTYVRTAEGAGLR